MQSCNQFNWGGGRTGPPPEHPPGTVTAPAMGARVWPSLPLPLPPPLWWGSLGGRELGGVVSVISPANVMYAAVLGSNTVP